MIYCKNCILPNSRPNIVILNNGICSACNSHINKKKINWKKRNLNFQKIVKKIKNKKLSYDCLIPVSGGKDGWVQAKMISEELGLKVLCVTLFLYMSDIDQIPLLLYLDG